MAEGITDKNITALEKKAGQKAARTIQRNWKAILATATTKQTGTLLSAATARATMRYNALEAISIGGTSATFKQHYGFEGIKSNGVAMEMKPFDHFTVLFQKSERALQKLGEELAEIKGVQVTTKIQEAIKVGPIEI